MNSSNNRKDGGAYRRYKTMVSLNCKAGKDRSKARQRKKRKSDGIFQRVSGLRRTP